MMFMKQVNTLNTFKNIEGAMFCLFSKIKLSGGILYIYQKK